MSQGSVKRDKERGSWYFVVDVPSPRGGRQQLRRRGFATKKLAVEALSNVVSDQSRGTFVRPTLVSVSDYLLNEWLPAKQPTIRPSTAAAYEQSVRNYIVPNIGGALLTDVDGSMLNGLYNQLLTSGRTETRRGLGPGLSAKTVRNVHGILARAFRDAVRWGRLARNPCDAADPPAARSPEMKAWTGDEVRIFIESVSDHRWAAIWALMATTGMRRGEVLGLRWSDVDLDASTVRVAATRIRFGATVTASTPKTAAGVRSIAIGPMVAAQLRAWRKTQSEERLVMGAGWMNDGNLVVTLADGSAPNPESFSNLFNKRAKRAGLRPIRLHDLRHSYATAALAAGIPVKVVSQRLGHADIGVTLKVYAHVMPGDDAAAAIVADQLVEGWET
jgi:integrase